MFGNNYITIDVKRIGEVQFGNMTPVMKTLTCGHGRAL